MSIVVPSLHRPQVYPKATCYACPYCGAPVIIDQWTHTTADHEGEPKEDTGLGFYCTNKLCESGGDPIDEEWLSFSDAKS